MGTMAFIFSFVWSKGCWISKDFPPSRRLSDFLDFKKNLCYWPSIPELSDPLPFSGFWTEWTSEPWLLSGSWGDWRTSDPLTLLVAAAWPEDRPEAIFWSSLASWPRRSFKKLSRVVNFVSAEVVEFSPCYAQLQQVAWIYLELIVSNESKLVKFSGQLDYLRNTIG